MERGGDAPEEADRVGDLLEQILLLGHPGSRPKTFNHGVGIDVLEIIDLFYIRVSTLDAVCKGVASVQVWVERESERLFHTSLQACKPTSATGHVGLADPNLFDMTKECTTEAYSVQSSSRTV